MTRLKWVILCLVLLALVPMFIVGYRARYTCVICRSQRTDYVFFRTTWNSRRAETACTKWYRDNVEPVHSHIWSQSSSGTTFDLYGSTLGAMSNENRPGRAIWVLTPEEQIAVYQHFDDPIEARNLFVSLVDESSMSDRNDFLLVYSLRQWMHSGFDGPWEGPVQTGQEL